MPESIARTHVVCVTASGQRTPVVVDVGRPTQGDDGLWSCTVSLSGLFARLAPMRSHDSLHALCLGLFLVRNLLWQVIDDGGRIVIAGDGDQDCPLDAFFAPPLPRHPSGEES
jgi:hypothetical protein